MIQVALGVPVRTHDDGSMPGMHDLRIVYPDRPSGAVEVTAAADPDAIALWKLVNGSGERWIEPELIGGWMVELNPTARAKRLRSALPGLLRVLESQGLGSLRPRGHPSTANEDFARDLGVRGLHQSGTQYPGSIYVTLHLPAERSGGWVADNGDALALWIGDFILHEPARRDVLEKLARSGAEDRHVFVLLPGFTTAPFGVSDLLMRGGPPLPLVAPQLPAEVTHTWAVSTWNSGSGFRWDPQIGWSTFTKP